MFLGSGASHRRALRQLSAIPVLLVSALLLLFQSSAVGKPLVTVLPQVLMPWRNALLPCNCSAGGSMDCSERGKMNLTMGDYCPEPIREVNLFGNSLTVFPPSFGVATVINISRNHLEEMPSIASFTLELEVLDLSENSISKADTELNPLPALQILNVNGNQLTHLRFIPLKCVLVTLNAARNSINTLEGSLQKCISMQTLNLARNELSAIEANMFSIMTNLRELDLSWNPLQKMSTNVFQTLVNLTNLRLNSIGLSVMPDDVFISQQNLEHLELAENALTSITEQVFVQLTKLKYLNIAKNRFKTLPAGLEKAAALTKLDVSCNAISSLPEKIGPFHDLQDLSLQTNNLTILPENVFSEVKSLKTLRLGVNPLKSFPVLQEMSNLQMVTMPLMKVTPEALKGLEKVPNVVFSLGSVTSLPASAFSTLRSLTALSLERVPLQELSKDSLVGLPQLQYFSLGLTLLTTLPSGLFAPVPRLEGIELLANRLEELPKGIFSGLKSLRGLLIFGNGLKELPETLFEGLGALVRLDLSRNELKSLPLGLLNGLTSLREFYVEHNRLTTLPPPDPSCRGLRDVSFANNSIATADHTALSAWVFGSEEERFVNLGTANRLRVRALSWLLHDPQLSLTADDLEGCNCGFVRRHLTLVRLCVDMQCGSEGPKNWIEALKAD